jgi:hypothetical protein
MDMETSTTVWVRRQYNDKDNRAAYRLSDIDGWHLSDVSGGRQDVANRAYWHAYVMCDAMIEGQVGHSCTHGPAPHRIKICVVKKDNDAAWSRILRAAEGESVDNLIRNASYKRIRGHSKVEDILDCIVMKKFSQRALGERRLSEYKRVPSQEVEHAWQALVGPLGLTNIGMECARYRFDEEMLALRG